MTPDVRAEEMLRRSGMAFNEFTAAYIMWERLCEIFYQERCGFFTDQPLTIDQLMLNHDNEPARLRRDTGNMYGSFLRPRGREWFKAAVGEPDEEEVDLSFDGSLWLEEATKRLRRIIYRKRAMFTEQMSLDDHDYITLGNSVSTHVLLQDKSGYVARNKHLKNIAWAENADGEVDQFYEKAMLTASQQVAMFGPTKLAKNVLAALDPKTKNGNPFERFPVQRMVLPSSEWAWGRNEFGRMAPARAMFASVYICPTGKQVLDEKWFTYNPYHLRRWSKAQGRAWGTSIITPVALADGRALSVVERSICEAIEKTVDPPLLVKNETTLSNVRVMAGGVTVGADIDYRTGRPIEIAHEVGNPAYGMEYAKQKREFLSKVFLENPLKLPVDREMTLGEVEQRVDEISRAAAPVFEPGEMDNQNLLEKPFQIALDMGAFPPMPEELQGAEVRFELDTLLTQAIDKVRVMQAKGVGEYVVGMMEWDPDVVRYIDKAKMHRDALRGMAPLRWTRDPDDVDAEIEDAAEQSAQQGALSMAAELGKSGAIKSIVDKGLEQPNGLAAIPAVIDQVSGNAVAPAM